MKKGQIDESIFRHSDIRGVYPSELNEEEAYKIGRALVVLFKARKFIVGFDGRVSSPSLYDAVTAGMRDQGADVLCIGLIDTPRLYFASGKFKLPGVMITASHNPSKYNGIKIVDGNAIPLGEENGLLRLRDLTIKNSFTYSGKKGKEERISLEKVYEKYILSFINRNRIKDLSIVVDAGNGVSGKFVSRLCSNLGIKLNKLFFESDGRFPNHTPNPLLEENTEELSKKVIDKKTDFGVAFDADADRVFFVDENGSRVNSSIIGSLILRELAKNHSGKVIYNTPSSKIFGETAKSCGLKAYHEKVGHAYIKLRMRKIKAFFASEHSGHFYFRENFNSDSAFIAFVIVCLVYSEMKKDGRTFSEMLIPFKKYSTSEEINVRCSKVDRLFNILKSKFGKSAKIETFDGLTIGFKDWWFNIRKSGNENLVRLNVEASDERKLKIRIKELSNVIAKV